MSEENNKNQKLDAETVKVQNNQAQTDNPKNNSKYIIIKVIIAIITLGLLVFLIYYSYETSHYDLKKPIIYLYPKEQIELSVKLGYPENITCSYPSYVDGWKVIANPDGTLIDTNSGRQLYSLYWEGLNNAEVSMDEGFVIKGEDTLSFLEEKLATLGLNEFEAEEFIVYWLPKLQNNKYNFIRFATMDEINSIMPLEFSIEPDSLIRVLMEYKPLDKYMEVKEQQLMTPERTGFVVVEWGGTEI